MDRPQESLKSPPKNFSIIITIVALLMVVFGTAEVFTGFTHQFYGLSLAQGELATILGIALGLCYIMGGLLLFTRRYWAAAIAMVLLCVDILGRIAMVITGLYPIDSFRQAFGIIVGTAIAAAFAVYIYVNRRFFQKNI